jgi:hypothetical protein
MYVVDVLGSNVHHYLMNKAYSTQPFNLYANIIIPIASVIGQLCHFVREEK